MISPLEYLGGCAALVVLLACPLVGASWIERAFVRADSPARRALAVGLVAWALLVFPVLVLGAIGALSLVALLGVQAALFAATWRVTRGRRRAAPARAKWDLDTVDVALFALYGTAAAYLAWVAISRPPLAWDTMQYHLPLAAEWLRAGELVPLQHPHAVFQSYFPATGELLNFIFVLPFSNDLFFALPGLFLLALQGLAIHRIAIRAGAPPKLARFAPALYLLTPCALRLGPTGYVEPAYGAALFAAIALLLDYRDERRSIDLLSCGAALALLAGIKYTGLLTALPIAAIAIAYALRAPAGLRRGVLGAVGVGAALFTLGCYWYWRNLALTGHPFYPSPVRLFGWEVLSGVAKPLGAARLGHDLNILSALPELLESGELWRAVMGTTAPDRYELGIGPKVLVLAIVVLCGVVSLARRAVLRVPYALFALALAVFVTTPFWLLHWLYVNMRFAAPALGLAAALAVAVLAQWRAGARAVAFVALGCLIPDLLSLTREMSDGFRVAAPMAALAIVLGIVLRDRWGRLSRAARVAVSGAAAVLACFGGYHLHAHREATRFAEYREGTTLYETSARLYAPAWEALERAAEGGAPGRSVRVAHAGFAFISPLYGRRLERAVLYVPVNARAGALHDYPNAEFRRAPNESAWLANLAKARADYLIVHHPDPGVPGRWPVEASWADLRPERFARLFANRWARLYRVQAVGIQ